MLVGGNFFEKSLLGIPCSCCNDVDNRETNITIVAAPCLGEYTSCEAFLLLQGFFDFRSSLDSRLLGQMGTKFDPKLLGLVGNCTDLLGVARNCQDLLGSHARSR